ncbi:MAG: hypothetical protein OEW05_06355 [Candidatus Aminicenantes bacterium]|nr:hypothetical protein [Candidatus Aminicenantes bacterium]
MRKSRFVRFIVSTAAFLSLAAVLTAHVPLQHGRNDSLASALRIENFTKSWALYEKLERPGTALYYRFELRTGDKLHFSLFAPERTEFAPTIYILGPGLPVPDGWPDALEVPAGYGAIVIPSRPGHAPEYEPFTPTYLYPLVEYDYVATTAGTYYAAVHEPQRAGAFGLAIGYVESFSPSEWLLIPLDTARIRLWEGQSRLFAFGPAVLVLVLGLLVMASRRRGAPGSPPTAKFWLATIGGLLCLGTSAVVLVQMGRAAARGLLVPAMLVSLFLAIVPALVGILALRAARKSTGRRGPRPGLIILGLAGFVFWAGFLAGPAMILLAGLLPGKR